MVASRWKKKVVRGRTEVEGDAGRNQSNGPDFGVNLAWPDTARTDRPFDRPPALGPAPVQPELVWEGADAEQARATYADAQADAELADRILDRLTTLRADVSSELAMLRAEIVVLRHAISENSASAEIHALRQDFAQLRTEVTGLGNIVIDWPELHQVTSDIATLRDALEDVADAVTARAATDAVLVEGLAAVEANLAALAPVAGRARPPAGLDVPLEDVAEPAPKRKAKRGASPRRRTGLVDLNTATADELRALPGVGPATAAAIVAHREAHGRFRSIVDLLDVHGITEAKFEAIRVGLRV